MIHLQSAAALTASGTTWGQPRAAPTSAHQVEGVRRMAQGGFGSVTGVESVGFIELEGKGTPVEGLTDPAEVATACSVLQKVGSWQWMQHTAVAAGTLRFH